MYLGFLKMGMYLICKIGFKIYHTFSIPTPTLGKKKRNQPKKRQTKPHYPCSSYNKTLQLPAGPVSHFVQHFQKWICVQNGLIKSKGNQNQREQETETRAFLWALAITPYLFCKMGASLLNSQKKKMHGQQKVTRRTI